MNMLIEELARLSGDWKAWALVGVLALMAIHKLVLLFMCPVVHGTADFTAEEVAEAKAHRFNPSVWFALAMLGGVAITIAGLFMIANGIHPAIALALLVAGVVVIQSEPARFLVREQRISVIAASDGPADILEGERDRLKGAHRALATINVVILAGVVAALAAF